MMSTTAFLFILTITSCLCQRPFYAGLSPIGYPADTPQLTNKFGDAPLPPQLNGDKASANRIDNLPVDQQPIWWINRPQYEEAMKNPQTYPQRPSIFNENTNRV